MLPRVFKNTNAMPGSFINDFFNDDFFSLLPTLSRNYENSSTPAVNVEETENDYQITVAAPGIDKKDFKLSVDENVLNISSSKEEKNKESKDGYLLREFNYNSFSRSFTLPENTDASKINASHKNGILYINIPKKAITVQKAKEIKIN